MPRAEFMLIRRDGGPSTPFYGEASQMELKLPADRVYSLAIDQSSKSTGIYITDKDVNFHFIGTITRNGAEKYSYYRDLRLFIQMIIHERELEVFLTERLLPNNRGYSLPVLAELKGYINTWKGEMEELRVLPSHRFTEMHPSTWKSLMMDKSKGKNRSNKKREIALDIVDKFPELRDYFNIVPSSSDYDGFDACGILHGFRISRNLDGHDENAVEKIAGIKSYAGDVFVYYRPMSLEQATDVEYLLEGFEFQAETYGKTFLSADTESTWYANVKKAASTLPFCMTAVEDPKHRAMLRWHMDLGSGDTPWIAYIVRKNVMIASQREMLARHYKHEEITF